VQQIEKFTVALKEAYEQVDPKLVVPYYVTVPPHPSLQFSSRRRFPLAGGSLTFLRRQESRVLAAWLMEELRKQEFAAHIYGPQGVGKSHLLHEVVLLLTEQSDCRVVYEHDCASWAGLANMPIKATLYWLRSVAMAFAQDPEVLGLCRQFIERVSVMTDIVAAEDAVCNSFLPQLGDLCKRLKLKVFFVFDQHNSLTPEMRTKFPYSLPESQLLRVSQLRGVGMVVISASANNEYFLKLATLEPPLPTRLVTSGFDFDELRVFMQHERFDGTIVLGCGRSLIADVSETPHFFGEDFIRSLNKGKEFIHQCQHCCNNHHQELTIAIYAPYATFGYDGCSHADIAADASTPGFIHALKLHQGAYVKAIVDHSCSLGHHEAALIHALPCGGLFNTYADLTEKREKYGIKPLEERTTHSGRREYVYQKISETELAKQ
jgi:hypothetical protein